MQREPTATTSLAELALLFLRLGATAFGGPAAHIAMMRDEVVHRRKWLSDERFLDLLGATNLIPGPNSTEMAIHIGWGRRRWAGLVVAGVTFIIPAMLITGALGWAYVRFGKLPEAAWLLWGIKPVILAVVLQALWSLAPTAARTWPLRILGVGAVTASALGVHELLVLFGSGALVALVWGGPWRRDGYRFAYESIFRHGLFNADPNPGNYLFHERGVTFLDFGCVKRFPAEHLARWRAVIRAILERDFSRAAELWVESGYIPDPEGFDFAFHHQLSLHLHQPWLVKGPFTFTQEFIERTWRMSWPENRNRFRLTTPKHWVFTYRLNWGLYAVLAKLGARGNWRSPILDILYGEGEARPRPYSDSELALLAGLPT